MKELTQFLAGIVAFGLLLPLYGSSEDVEEVRKKAEAGQAVAQLDLGWMYQHGDDVPQDDAEAVKWYRRAAEQGSAEAQSNLGTMYIEGRGVPQDRAEALKWFRKAARKGHAGAQYNLGVAHASGDGVPRDYGEAIKWFRKAAERKDPYSQSENVDMYRTDNYVPWGLRWRRGIANRETAAAAQNNLGFMYERGEGVEQDYNEAFKWYRKAAEQGYAQAQSNLANMYRTGHGVPQDYNEALKWYRLAAEQGYTLAQNHLGAMHALGTGVSKDFIQACQWFTLSAAAGDENGVKNRDNLVKRMPPEQIAEGQRLAREWLEAYRNREKE